MSSQVPDPVSVLLAAAEANQEDRRRCSFDIRASLADDFKAACVRRGVVQREAIEALLEFFVNKAEAEDCSGGESEISAREVSPESERFSDVQVQPHAVAVFELPEPRPRTELKKLTVELDEELVDRFRAYCKRNGYQQREIIRAALEAALERIEAGV
tara:strand:- start:752 stop:1225 length:474 start_codon:yes stop_codon:yes gene_type:complete